MQKCSGCLLIAGLALGFSVAGSSGLGSSGVPGANVAAAEPGWSPVIIARGDYRQQIQSMPIELRPYRPLHFYGNTVRRNYYRGTPLPIGRTPLPIVRTRPTMLAPAPAPFSRRGW